MRVYSKFFASIADTALCAAMYADLADEKGLARILIDHSFAIRVKAHSPVCEDPALSMFKATSSNDTADVQCFHTLQRTPSLEGFLENEPWIRDCLTKIAVLVEYLKLVESASLQASAPKLQNSPLYIEECANH